LNHALDACDDFGVFEQLAAAGGSPAFLEASMNRASYSSIRSTASTTSCAASRPVRLAKSWSRASFSGDNWTSRGTPPV
jgi:hypothetical protein